MAFKFNKSKLSTFPKSEEELLSFINGLHDENIRERIPIEFQWALNASFYLGHQDLTFNPYTQTLGRPRKPRAVEIVINRLAPFIETRVAKITKNRPILSVDAFDSTDRAQQKAAKLSTDLLKYLWEKLEMDDITDELVTHLHLTGSSFLKVGWNPLAGDTIERIVESNEKDVFIDPDTGKFKTEKISMGEIDISVKTAFNILPDPSAKTIEGCDWIMERNFKSVLDARESYPEIADILGQGFGKGTEMTQMEKFVGRLGSTLFSGFGGSSPEDKKGNFDMVLVKEFWLRPNIFYPEGILATIVGDLLARVQTLPYYEGNNPIVFPYVKFDEKRNPYGFWGKTTLERLIPLQKQYNKDRRQLARNTHLMAAGKWLLPKGSQVAEDSITNEEGEIIEYNPNLPKPEQATIKPLPQYIVENMTRSIIDMTDVSGERAASALPAGNITAGVAMQVQQEIQDIIIGPIVKRFEHSMKKVGNTALKLANQFYDDPRRIKIIGQNDAIDIEFLTNADLKNQTDVKVVVESAFPQFKAAMRQAILDMWDRRIITDPKVILKAFMSGDFEGLMKQDQKEDDQIILDIEAIKQGKEPMVHQFQNHAGYVDKLSKFSSTPEFFRMPSDRQEILFNIINQHLAFLQQQFAPPGGAVAPDAQTNQAAVGTPFGPQLVEGQQAQGG